MVVFPKVKKPTKRIKKNEETGKYAPKERVISPETKTMKQIYDLPDIIQTNPNKDAHPGQEKYMTNVSTATEIENITKYQTNLEAKEYKK